ncbi:MAG: hypothetical protein Q7S66_01565 [bacterium]|nr:hypothetical protein [bacterium]
MVDKIQKALNKFSLKEKQTVKNLLLMIKEKNLVGLDIKKLKGREDIYRVRKGKIRIIYRMNDDEIYLLAIEKKNENTYKDI